jgi:hypothetical protein
VETIVISALALILAKYLFEPARNLVCCSQHQHLQKILTIFIGEMLLLESKVNNLPKFLAEYQL